MGAAQGRDAAPHASLFDVPALTGEMRLARVPRREATYLLVLPNNFARAAAQIAELLRRLEADFAASGARSRSLTILPTDSRSPFPQVGAAQLRAELAALFPAHAAEALLLAKEDVRRPRADIARYLLGNALPPAPASPFQLYKLARRERAFVPGRAAEPCECFERLG